ncbi:Plasmodium exported protein, unknown function [Plasmodium knowlesi strain H]|uniref:Pv-fam-d protein n=3 Tax=Plasmodium knowlesi TaxID=5850 RepID=A0A5K1UE81_PLAKH|nr:Plasmodium exported protein, unknown function [Plasmodium knowlesi strain H]OTN64451.1 Uncharacterized protein PKNOH_S130216100 [Plasmodium knowlesi]CAA9989321.1 Plasmodium exported protein, unknown function [Plasmodium knowlesi strain H]SBO26104.1 Plasmodium exported protein, unknown function [Plasmodium knowlesi strain H]SBO26753.1 Plasmodium exported protein, unknown function [Plasmodium knowlesi strain H]VVS78795.1 Plasmodium exported protein, unknown function [Plasmodium knowlesi strai|eukprot:XP_002261668.1 hypothetical protein, conserved in Plasmodium species [Plasmodium knowlesi strain H]
MKENSVKSIIFVKVATFILLACTNQMCNDSDTLGRSLVKKSSANGEFHLGAERLLGESGSWQDSLLIDKFYDDDLFDYDSDNTSRRHVKDRHHHHSRNHRHERGHSHRHRTSRRKRDEKNNEKDEVLSLSRFDIDDEEEDHGERSSSRHKFNDYDDVINLTSACRPNSKHRVSSINAGLPPQYGDDFIFRGGQGFSGMVKKADGYCENKRLDGFSAMDKYKGYHAKEKRIMKRGSNGKAAKVVCFLGAVALSNELLGFLLTTSSIVSFPLAASACLLGGLFYKKKKGKNKYKRQHLKSITY